MKRLWLAVSAISLVGVVIIALLLLLPKSPIPGPIKQQLTSTLLLPKDSRVVIDRGSAKYDPSLKLLTFNATAFGKQLVISEQPTPDSFTDVPQAYQKVLDSMNGYSDFDTSIGSVHLARPAQLKGKQAAVVNSKGTLLFAKPSADLLVDQWRQFFNSFDVQH